MRGNGISYDTGFINAGVSTHEPFDPDVVKREMRVIHDDLHYNAKGVDTAFANTFASYHLPHRGDPREDLDMASYGVVKVFEDRLGHTYPNMAWEPKAAFTTLADYYRR